MNSATAGLLRWFAQHTKLPYRPLKRRYSGLSAKERAAWRRKLSEARRLFKVVEKWKPEGLPPWS
jgi:hypothetical protein